MIISKWLWGGAASAAAAFSNLYSAQLTSSSSQSASIPAATLNLTDHAKFAIAGIWEEDVNGAANSIITQWGGSGATNALIVDLLGGKIRFATYVGGAIQQHVTSTVYSAGTRRSFLLWYDSANAIAADRKRLWVDGVEVTVFNTGNTVTGPMDTKAQDFVVGATGSGANYANGKRDELYMFDGVLPPYADVFNGDNTVKDMDGYAGLLVDWGFENTWEARSISGKALTPSGSPTFVSNP